MKVSRQDISPSMQATYQQLRSLRDEVNMVNEEAVVSAITLLQKNANQLVREINQSVEIVPFDSSLKSSLIKLIHEIQHSSVFSQALGPHQVELMGLFRRLENSIEKVDYKVVKSEKISDKK